MMMMPQLLMMIMVIIIIIIDDRQSNAISVATVGLYLQQLYVGVSELRHAPPPQKKSNALAKMCNSKQFCNSQLMIPAFPDSEMMIVFI
jgi:uncharacterized membrane protein YqjE